MISNCLRVEIKESKYVLKKIYAFLFDGYRFS